MLSSWNIKVTPWDFLIIDIYTACPKVMENTEYSYRSKIKFVITNQRIIVVLIYLLNCFTKHPSAPRFLFFWVSLYLLATDIVMGISFHTSHQWNKLSTLIKCISYAEPIYLCDLLFIKQQNHLNFSHTITDTHVSNHALWWMCT